MKSHFSFPLANCKIPITPSDKTPIIKKTRTYAAIWFTVNNVFDHLFCVHVSQYGISNIM